MTKICNLLAIVGLISVSLANFGSVSARAMPTNQFMQPMMQFGAIGDTCFPTTTDFFGFPAWYVDLHHKVTSIDKEGKPECNIVIDQISDLWLIAFPIMQIIIMLAGYVAVGFIIWGSILFIKSQGDSGKIMAARGTIRDAVIGLVIAALSIAIIKYVAGQFKG